MEIEKEVYNWLCQIKVLPINSLSKQSSINSSKILLDNSLSLMFQNGMAFVSLFQNLNKEFDNSTNLCYKIKIPVLPYPNQEQLSPAKRIGNWKALIETLKELKIVISEDEKNLLFANDLEIISEILTRVWKFFITQQKIRSEEQIPSLNSSVVHLNREIHQRNQELIFQKMQLPSRLIFLV